MKKLTDLPTDLPEPIDDGACDRLEHKALPAIVLRSTGGDSIDLSKLEGYVVIYCYPMTGRPDSALPSGWDQIPGARGCTPQSCAFRDHHQELSNLNVQAVYGISTQNTEYQLEAVQRLHLPFELLSDLDLELATSLGLPILEVAGKKLLKRVTLIVENRKIVKVFYPVFPPDKNAEEVIRWLQQNTA